MTVPTFTPPHPQSVLRYLHQARRDYAATGNAAGADIPTIANQAAANPMTVNGTVYRAPGVHMPSTVAVSLYQSSTSKGTQTVNVNQSTGAFSATIPGGSASAGAGVTVCVVGAAPAPFPTNSNTFTLT